MKTHNSGNNEIYETRLPKFKLWSIAEKKMIDGLYIMFDSNDYNIFAVYDNIGWNFLWNDKHYEIVRNSGNQEIIWEPKKRSLSLEQEESLEDYKQKNGSEVIWKICPRCGSKVYDEA